MTSLIPYLQPDKLGEYQDKLVQLYMADSALNQTIPQSIRTSTEWLLRQVNCFYSNKIEGNATHPKDLLKTQDAQAGPQLKRPSGDLLELLVHLEAQIKAQSASTTLAKVCTQDFIRELHRSFYAELPEVHRVVKDLNGDDVLKEDGTLLLIEPGEYRKHDVKVGLHIPPEHAEIAGYMGWLERLFNPENIHGTTKVIAAAGLHHRLAWIHPFQDGNGRVIRLLTDCYMRCAGFGGYGLWSITRGFGRNTQAYYSALAAADRPRQGDSDGRGILSDAGLLHFTQYFIDTALDQVSYFTDLLEPRRLGIRIDIYFEMRAKGGYPDLSGKNLPLLNIVARDVYRTLLEKGAMSRAAVGQHLGKDERSLRAVFKQMEEEGLVKEAANKEYELKLSSGSIEVLFPNLW